MLQPNDDDGDEYGEDYDDEYDDDSKSKKKTLIYLFLKNIKDSVKVGNSIEGDIQTP